MGSGLHRFRRNRKNSFSTSRSVRKCFVQLMGNFVCAVIVSIDDNERTNGIIKSVNWPSIVRLLAIAGREERKRNERGRRTKRQRICLEEISTECERLVDVKTLDCILTSLASHTPTRVDKRTGRISHLIFLFRILRIRKISVNSNGVRHKIVV